MSEIEDYFTIEANTWVQDAYADESYTIGYERNHHVLSFLKKMKNEKTLRVLDLGCGGGHLACEIAKIGHIVTAVDQSEMMCAQTREKATSYGLKLQIIQSSIDQFLKSCEANQFDLITCIGVIYYLPNIEEIFSEINRCLSKNGVSIISFRNKLFNLFPGSKYFLETINEPNFLSLAKEFHQAASTPIRLNSYHAHLHALKENLSNDFSEGFYHSKKIVEENAFAKKMIVCVQHSPEQIKTLTRNLFEVKEIIAIHPHWLQNVLHHDEIIGEKHRKISIAMRVLAKEPAALSFSSHFIAISEKAG